MLGSLHSHRNHPFSKKQNGVKADSLLPWISFLAAFLCASQVLLLWLENRKIKKKLATIPLEVP
ncbi:hypothetical protein IJ00_20385 [Calothrix sp. 336/3]|nr:hypothetical protein IJ00_20385 [Calothrix sp. 336/3]